METITQYIYVYYSYDGERVSITSPESKKFYGLVRKNSESTKDPDFLENNGFLIRFKDGKVYVEISGKDYQISNINRDSLFLQLSGATITNGVSENVKFGFSLTSPETVTILLEGSDLYNKAEKEFIRKTNLSLYKKTTKLIPGHKYELESGTFWYLGEVYSHRSEYYSSRTYLTSGSRQIHAFINDYTPGITSDEIFRDYVISETKDFPNTIIPGTIMLIPKTKSMVDIGPEIPVLTKSIEEIMEEKLEKFVNENKKPYSYRSERYHYTGIPELFTLFDVTFTENTPNITPKIKELIEEITKNEFRYNLFLIYGLKSNSIGYSLNSGMSLEDKITNLIKLYGSNFRDRNYYFQEYLLDLYKKVFGINLENLADEELNIFDVIYPTLDNQDIWSFHDLINNFRYLQYRKPESYVRNINFVYTQESKRSFDTFIKKGPYQDLIKEIYQKALENNGGNLEYSSLENVGTSKNIILRYNFRISLKDIEAHLGISDISEISDELKKDIMKIGAYYVDITTSEDIKIKS